MVVFEENPSAFLGPRRDVYQFYAAFVKHGVRLLRFWIFIVPAYPLQQFAGFTTSSTYMRPRYTSIGKPGRFL